MKNTEVDTTLLFRPVGQIELELIKGSDCKRFPPRLFHQPIFYPVLNREYAEKIARDWNTKDLASGFVGYVTSFRVMGSPTTQSPLVSRISIPRVLPSDYGNCVGALYDVAFRGSIPNLYIPLSTLHVPPYGCPRMTRGRCGLLNLQRMALASTTPCRSPGAFFHCYSDPKYWRFFIGTSSFRQLSSASLTLLLKQ